MLKIAVITILNNWDTYRWPERNGIEEIKEQLKRERALQ